jgi:copper chaperone CopZ
MGCAANIQLALGDLPGVHEVVVNLPWDLVQQVSGGE